MKKEKEEYVSPAMEVIKIESADIITISLPDDILPPFPG